MLKNLIYKYKVLAYFFSLFLLGCNSASTPNEQNSVVTPPINSDVPGSNDEQSQQDISCLGIAKLSFVDAEASHEIINFTPSNVIDGNFSSVSRWSSSENNTSLVLTFNDITLLKGLSLNWYNDDARTYNYDVEISKDKVNWVPIVTSQSSDPLSTRSQYLDIQNYSVNYVKIIPKGNNIDNTSNLVEVEAFGCQTDVNVAINLEDWYLSIPVDESTNTKSKSIYESVLNNDYFNEQFFFSSTDGGLVFRAPIEGAKTSTNTKYTRTELREMLRSGNTSISTQGVNKNNWVFSSAPMIDQNAAGGVDGELIAELAVNYVTTTGDDSQVGRVIIGQIHANDDEPIRVYYRKLPHNNKGSIYLAHEIEGGDDIYFELIGTRSKSAPNPTNGIELNERFGYKISVVGNLLTFTLIREGQQDLVQVINMDDSGYDIGGQYMYFKAGVYNQNNSGDPKDYVQATFYKIENTHNGYIDK